MSSNPTIARRTAIARDPRDSAAPGAPPRSGEAPASIHFTDTSMLLRTPPYATAIVHEPGCLPVTFP